ncbi:hypothetical protein J3A72_000466 [Stenotrophomonas sp. PvP093]|uniref:LPD29 domain-containing protein n=1 Tax=unclassified Stenotrophomonas TaxID=196198 RepID=UPI001AE2FC5B|nr:LPD29 domain-containing protein [Stenotrophomonas sp. PvP093]MBP2480174.1 hypothetical protein [Stenotrophomonas sp. PvP093]
MQNDLIPVGQIVHTNLCGFGAGVVVRCRPHPTAGQLYDVVFSDGRAKNGLSVFSLRGRQWRLLDEIACTEEVEACIERAAEYCKAEDARSAAAAAARYAEVASLRDAVENAHLVQLGRDPSPAQVAANIRRHLKHQFPGVRFSVRCMGHSSVVVGWGDGPAWTDVAALLRPFKAGRYDGQAESYVFDNSVWGEVFGSVLYIRCTRQCSDELIAYALGHVSGPAGEELTVQGYRAGLYVSDAYGACLPAGVASLQAWITTAISRSAAVGRSFKHTQAQ